MTAFRKVTIKASCRSPYPENLQAARPGDSGQRPKTGLEQALKAQLGQIWARHFLTTKRSRRNNLNNWPWDGLAIRPENTGRIVNPSYKGLTNLFLRGQQSDSCFHHATGRQAMKFSITGLPQGHQVQENGSVHQETTQ